MIELASLAGSAVFSDDRVYRYRLTRHLGTLGARGRVTWIMLNPSTADANRDDATVRRCRRASIAAGFAELLVVNLFAYRSAEPDDLLDASDPVGPSNDGWIARSVDQSDRVMLGWGAWPTAHRDFAARRIDQVLSIVADAGQQPMCLALTANGQPRHPLYVPNRATARPWSIPA